MGLTQQVMTYYDLSCDECGESYNKYDEYPDDRDELETKALDAGWVVRGYDRPRFGLYYHEWLCPDCASKMEE